MLREKGAVAASRSGVRRGLPDPDHGPRIPAGATGFGT
jgi:hypothetical protein